MQSHRQWRESRDSKTKTNQDLIADDVVVEETPNAKGFVRSKNSDTAPSNGHCDVLVVRKVVSGGNNEDNNGDARDDDDNSQNSEQKYRNRSLPAEFSNKELQQLVRTRMRRKQQEREATTDQDTGTDNIRTCSLDAFLKARETVRRNNKEEGIESSKAIDELIHFMLPIHTWFGGFLSESKGAIDKIQNRMLIDYNNNNNISSSSSRE